jgi:GNAT superfamily N-acetyltransferase
VQIRPATAADGAAMREIYVAAGRAAWEHFLPVEEIDAASEAAFDGDRGWVAEDESGVVGFTWLVGDELDTLYVHPRAQGRGIGRALMDTALAGRERTYLWTAEQNERTREIYERYGWRADGATRPSTYKGVTFVELRYEFTA